MHELPWITIFGHEWGDLPMIFMSDEVTSENHWQITSRVTKKIVIHGNECIILFLTCYFMSWTQDSAASITIAYFAIVAKDGLFYLALWRHHNWSVTSGKREALALWHHIRRLFLHMRIGARGIFSSE